MSISYLSLIDVWHLESGPHGWWCTDIHSASCFTVLSSFSCSTRLLEQDHWDNRTCTLSQAGCSGIERDTWNHLDSLGCSLSMSKACPTVHTLLGPTEPGNVWVSFGSSERRWDELIMKAQLPNASNHQGDGTCIGSTSQDTWLHDVDSKSLQWWCFVRVSRATGNTWRDGKAVATHTPTSELHSQLETSYYLCLSCPKRAREGS